MSRNFRVVEGGRLAFYSEMADAAFWDHHWKGKVSIDAYKDAIEGKLLWMDRPVSKWLPKEGKIVEAECGTGWWVVSLRKLGYDIEGVDFAKNTISQLKELGSCIEQVQ